MAFDCLTYSITAWPKMSVLSDLREQFLGHHPLAGFGFEWGKGGG